MNNQQVSLFHDKHDSLSDAIGTVVQALGGVKKVASELWPPPQTKIDTAASRLRACLNDEKPEKLSPDELLWIASRGREIGAHAIAEHFLFESGYEPPRVASPKEQESEAVAAIKSGTLLVSRGMALLERIYPDQHASLRAVSK